ncbi:hypothetical protein Tco_0502609 [Tanacetum coccineum]
MHQPWRTFAALINRSLSGKTSGFDKLQASHIYGAILLDSLTTPAMKESKAYKTYLGYATGEVPPKVARKFKKASPFKKDSDLASNRSRHQRASCGNKVKRKEKEKVDVAHGKRIELLSDVALTEEALLKEVRKKSLRDFYRTHPSGSGSIAEQPLRIATITPTITSEGIGEKPWVPDVTEEDSTESESESWGNDEDDKSEDDDQEEEEFDQEKESKDDEIKNIPHGDTEIVSLLDVHVHHEVPRTQAPTLLTIPVSVIIESSPSLLRQESKRKYKDQLPQILPEEVSNFAPPVIKKLFKESRDEVTLAKLKKILIDKMKKSGSYLAAPEHQDCYDSLKKSYDLDKDFFYSYDTSKDAEPTTGPKEKDSTSGSSKGPKSQLTSSGKYVQSEELVFEVVDSDIPQDQEGNLGDNMIEQKGKETNYIRMTGSRKPNPPQEPTDLDCTPIDFSTYILNGLQIKNLTQEILLGPAYKLLHKAPALIMMGIRIFKTLKNVKALSESLIGENPFEYFINNDLNYLQGGVSTMTSTTKIKAAKYDLPGIEDMVPNIWSPVKVAYGLHALWGLRINDIEDMLILVAQNQLINLSGEDVADFTIALKMFTRSLVIQRRVEDLQLGVESYQKKINVNKPDTTRPDLRKWHPYTPYKDPQGFIYVDEFERNRHYQEYRQNVLAEEKMKQIGKEKSSLYDQRHQQDAEGKENDEEFGEIHWW